MTPQHQDSTRKKSVLQLDNYQPQPIEKKWLTVWQENNIYQTNTETNDKPKYYALSMFPYPSGKLHMGHVRNYTLTDVIARFKRMQGFHVLHPMGWDSFGLPAENAAIQNNIQPAAWTDSNIAHMKKQLAQLGLSVDWDREVTTCKPDYYQWTQWIFIALYKKGLAYKKEAPVNWCKNCETVLANEQVIDGKCWRDDSLVVKKNLSQWFFKITEYAQELLDGLDHLHGWPDRVLLMQKNWINRSIGAELSFPVDGHNARIEVFTTRPDTVFGVTYMVLAPEHPLVKQLVPAENQVEVEQYVQSASLKTEMDRLAADKQKSGVPLGVFAVNPFTHQKIPIWIADYVLVDYGTGAVMAVPAHDERDFVFAKTYDLPVQTVIAPDTENNPDSFRVENQAYTDAGILCHSGQFTGMTSTDAKQAIIAFAVAEGFGHKKIQYRLKDWLISRQRYWGTPIPVVYCEKCGTVPVSESGLPVVLPTDVDFSLKGQSPVSSSKTFLNTACPTCKSPAVRETDTMDTFVDSAWYYLRYIDAQNTQAAFTPEQVARWMPVDQYVGGIEHAILHLLYSRFIMYALSDSLSTEKTKLPKEPFKNLLTQGMVLKDGHKMSKSKGNIVDPTAIFNEFGADTARFFILSDSPPKADFDWKESAVEGCYKFLCKVWRCIGDQLAVLDDPLQSQLATAAFTPEISYSSLTGNTRLLYQTTHQTIAGITTDIAAEYQFNTVISKLRQFITHLSKFNGAAEAEKDPQCQVVLAYAVSSAIKLIAPVTPFIAEALWEKAGGKTSVHLAQWPVADPEALQQDTVNIVVQINGKVRDQFSVESGAEKAALASKAQSCQKIQPYLAGMVVVRTIVVPEKLVNFVVKPE